MSVPDYPLGETLDFKFTSRQFSDGVPTTLAGTPVIEVYENNDTVQITAGETLTVDFDGVTGLNNLRIVATGANGYEVGKSYQAIISVGTVGGTSVVGEVVAQFSIERSAGLYPTVTGRTLDVTATGEAGLDLANVSGVLGNADVSWIDGSNRVDVGRWLTVAPNVLIGNRVDSHTGNMAANVVTSAAMDTGAITAATLASDTITAAKIAANSIGSSELATDAITSAQLSTTAINEIRDAILSDSNAFAGANIDASISSRATPAQVNTEVDTALVDIGLDHLISAAVVGADIADDSIIAQIVSSAATADWDTFVNTTDSLQAIRDNQSGTAADIADAVWDEDATAHQTLGTFGQAIGDPVANAETIYEAVVTDAAGTNVAADIIAIQSDTDDIQTRLPAALVGGAMDADVSAIQNDVITAASIAAAAIGSSEAPNLDAAVSSRATPAQVNTEVSDVLKTDTVTLPPQSAPSLTPTMEEILGWLYKTFRNRKTQTATTWSLLADDESTVDSKATISDDGTTAIKQEIVTGP